MNIKRPKKRLDLAEQIKRFAIKKIRKEIKRAEDSVIDDWGDALELDPKANKPEIEKEIFNRQFVARSKIVKRSYRELSGIPRVKNFLKKNYGRELRYSKDEWFPLQWMLRDKKIRLVLDRYSVFVKFLNYLFNYNRRLTNEQRKKMVELTDSITDGRKYNDYDFAVFVTDAKFWENASQKLGVSEISLKKLLNAFHKAGLVIRLGQVCTGRAGRKPFLYADGYYVPFEDKLRKVSFIKDSKEIKSGLRNLQKFLANN